MIRLINEFRERLFPTPQRLPLNEVAGDKIREAVEVSQELAKQGFQHVFYGSLALALQLGWFHRPINDIDVLVDTPLGNNWYELVDNISRFIDLPPSLHVRARNIYDDNTYTIPTITKIEMPMTVRDIDFETKFGIVRVIPLDQGLALLTHSIARKADQDIRALRRLGVNI